MAKVIHCPCGTDVQGETDDETRRRGRTARPGKPPRPGREDEPRGHPRRGTRALAAFSLPGVTLAFNRPAAAGQSTSYPGRSPRALLSLDGLPLWVVVVPPWYRLLCLMRPNCLSRGTVGTRGTRSDGSTGGRRRLGAERSLVQIQSPRLADGRFRGGVHRTQARSSRLRDIPWYRRWYRGRCHRCKPYPRCPSYVRGL